MHDTSSIYGVKGLAEIDESCKLYCLLFPYLFLQLTKFWISSNSASVIGFAIALTRICKLGLVATACLVVFHLTNCLLHLL